MYVYRVYRSLPSDSFPLDSSSRLLCPALAHGLSGIYLSTLYMGVKMNPVISAQIQVSTHSEKFSL